MKDPARFIEPKRSSKNEIFYRQNLESFFPASIGSNVEKLQNFPKYTPVQNLRKFLCHTEIFKKIINIHGSIIDCGVSFGVSLMTWSALSEIFEPLNHTRNIIGFDTFSGFPKITKNDKNIFSKQSKQNGLSLNSYNDILKCISLYDSNRFLPHINKVKLVKGNAEKTIPRFLKKNWHTIVALLHLDFDIYEPTKIALKYFLPRMPKGAIIVFDELNHEAWPGETSAVLNSVGIRNLKIERLFYGSTMSYAVLE